MQRAQLDSEAFDRFVEGAAEKRADPTATGTGWPEPLDRAAFHGPAGLFVKIVEPHTEADPAALLVQFLIAAGNIMGRKAYRIADGARHYSNLNAVLVGDTSHGRKGSAWAQVRRAVGLLDSDWMENHVASGLSSGEGLIWAVRDPIERREAIKEKGRFTGEYQSVVVDDGVADKRLCVIESEFASVLKVCDREANILSPIIRQSWDSGDLRTLTKNTPAKATGAHISIIGHITQDELLRGLNSTEAANGFANRFLWVCTRHSKELPFGGNLHDADFDRLIAALRPVLAKGADSQELDFNPAASGAWIKAYSALSAGRPGLLGAVLGRSEAQVLRLACLYAALDDSALVEMPHLGAALAVWEYSERSAELIFGDRLGDPDADAILSALRGSPNGLTRTDISKLFGRNLSADRIDRALSVLASGNLANMIREQTGGRPSERWVTKETKINEIRTRPMESAGD